VNERPSRIVWGASVTAWLTLVALFAITILSYTDRYVFSVLADSVRTDLALSDAQLGLIQGAAFAFSYSTAALVLIRWADALPGRALLLTGLVVWSFGTLLSGLAHSLEALAAARMMVGLGEAALFPATIPMISRLFPPQRRGFATSLLVIGSIAASGVALIVSGTLLQVSHAMHTATWLGISESSSWRFVLIVLGVPAILGAPLVLLIPASATGAGPTTVQAKEARPGLDTNEREPQAVRTRRRLILGFLLAGMTLWALVDYGLNAWLASDLMRRFGATPGDIAGQLGVASTIAGTLGPLTGGFLGDWLQTTRLHAARTLVCVVTVLLAIPTTLLSLAPSMALCVILFSVYTFLTAIAFTVAVTALQEAAPPSFRGRTMALQGFLCTSVGMGVGPFAVARLSDYLAADGSRLAVALTAVSTPTLSVGALLFVIAWLRSRNVTNSEPIVRMSRIYD
jgi:MFS family permease